MDSTTLTPSPRSLPSSPSPTASQELENAPGATRRALSPEEAGELKPELLRGAGSPDRLGSTITADGVNFAVYSETASALWVSIYDELDREVGRLDLEGHTD